MLQQCESLILGPNIRPSRDFPGWRKINSNINFNIRSHVYNSTQLMLFSRVVANTENKFNRPLNPTMFYTGKSVPIGLNLPSPATCPYLGYSPLNSLNTKCYTNTAHHHHNIGKNKGPMLQIPIHINSVKLSVGIYIRNKYKEKRHLWHLYTIPGTYKFPKKQYS